MKAVVRRRLDVISKKRERRRACEVDLDGATFYIQEHPSGPRILIWRAGGGWGPATAKQKQKVIEATRSYFAQE